MNIRAPLTRRRLPHVGVQNRSAALMAKGIMALRFVGIDLETETGDSSTVWPDEEKREFVIQGWKAGEELRELVTATPAPNHAPGIPDHEDVVRLRMSNALRKALDVRPTSLDDLFAQAQKPQESPLVSGDHPPRT